MEVTLATFSDYAVVDQTGKLSIMGIFDVIGAPRFPAIHPQIFICIRFQFRSIEFKTQHAVRLVLQDPDGRQVVPAFEIPKLEVQSPVGDAPYSYTQVSLGLQGIRLPKPGTYSAEIAVDGIHRASIPLHVVLAGPGEPTIAQEPAGASED
jgi:hypothetical protein